MEENSRHKVSLRQQIEQGWENGGVPERKAKFTWGGEEDGQQLSLSGKQFTDLVLPLDMNKTSMVQKPHGLPRMGRCVLPPPIHSHWLMASQGAPVLGGAMHKQEGVGNSLMRFERQFL